MAYGYNPADDPYAAVRYPTSPGAPEMNPAQRTPAVEPTRVTKGGAPADDFDTRISQTLRKRYGDDFDLNDPDRGLTYFKRRRDEEGPAYDTDYWDMRASGVNEAEYARAEAAKQAKPSLGYGGGSALSLADLFKPLAQTSNDNQALMALLQSRITGAPSASNYRPALQGGVPLDRQALADVWPGAR